MAMKRCSAFPKAPAFLEPHHLLVQCHIQDIGERGLTPLPLVYSTALVDMPF